MKKDSRLLNTITRALNGKKPKYRGRKHINAYTKTMRDLEWSRMYPGLSFPVYRYTTNKSRIIVRLDKGYIRAGVFLGFTEVGIRPSILYEAAIYKQPKPYKCSISIQGDAFTELTVPVTITRGPVHKPIQITPII